MKPINDPFLRMAVHATLGSFLGIFIGLLLALLIKFLSTSLLNPSDTDFTNQTIPFLGMGFGAVIGGLLGGVVGIRRKE